MIVALDVESTGLDPFRDQILQIACVVVTDLKLPAEEMPSFERKIWWDRLEGHPRALEMNAHLIRALAHNEPTDSHVCQDQMAVELSEWLFDQRRVRAEWSAHPMGFNVGQLDRHLLMRAYEGSKYHYPFHHRSVELGTLLMTDLGEYAPVTSNHAVETTLGKKVAHDALEDCLDAVRLWQAHCGYHYEHYRTRETSGWTVQEHRQRAKIEGKQLDMTQGLDLGPE